VEEYEAEFERFLKREPPPNRGDIEVQARSRAGSDKAKQAGLIAVAERHSAEAAEAVKAAFAPAKGRGGARAGAGRPPGSGEGGEDLNPLDFVHVLEPNQYAYRPTRVLCSEKSVDKRVRSIKVGDDKYVKALDWIARNQAVEQMTWAPGEPEFVRDKYIAHGGWFAHKGGKVYNVYSGPVRTPRAGDVSLYTGHLKRIFPTEWEENLDWMAFKVQHPGAKINHALLWIGRQGIGKDTLLAPLREAVGPVNFAEAAPKALLGNFNLYERSAILRVSEAKDLGEVSRYDLYDRTKSLIAAPPEAVVINPKYGKQYYIPNTTGVIITSNYELYGISCPVTTAVTSSAYRGL
jgi:Family of unknown function (DUF5906)